MAAHPKTEGRRRMNWEFVPQPPFASTSSAHYTVHCRTNMIRKIIIALLLALSLPMATNTSGIEPAATPEPTPEATQTATEILAVDFDSDLNGITDELLQKIAAQEGQSYHALHHYLDSSHPYDAAKEHHLTDAAKINTFVKAFLAAFDSNMTPAITPTQVEGNMTPPMTPTPKVQGVTATTEDRSGGAFVGLLELMALLVVGLFVYFLPTLAARHKRNRGAIFVLNLLLGWSFIGWVIALVWACTEDR